MQASNNTNTPITMNILLFFVYSQLKVASFIRKPDEHDTKHTKNINISILYLFIYNF